MPRTPRIAFENAFYHVFNRGLAKQRIFIEDGDYIQFLKRLEFLKYNKGYDFEIYAYVLIPNHFHFLIQTKKISISKIMSSLLTSYSMYFNKKYKRVGVLFQNRFKSILCDKDNYFIQASRYIHLNPIEAGLIKDLNEYKWSSYQEIYGNSDFKLIDKSEIERLVGTTAKEKESYRKFVLEGMERIDDLKREYSFEKEDSEISGSPRFYTLSQKKYIRRKIRKVQFKTV